MNIKLDENIPWELVGELESLGHQVDTVLSEGLKGAKDHIVLSRVTEDSRFLITQDIKLAGQVFGSESNCGVMLVRMGSPSNWSLIRRVVNVLREIGEPSLSRSIVVVTDTRVRHSRFRT